VGGRSRQIERPPLVIGVIRVPFLGRVRRDFGTGTGRRGVLRPLQRLDEELVRLADVLQRRVAEPSRFEAHVFGGNDCGHAADRHEADRTTAAPR
jgi:hypothetical protein